ncbi:MAG TPA: HD domain-containing phosphohydrolase [Terriglobia bacterium]|nr:HD domain-containing phosphohydrolase [Terriglobia bacterium]
MNPTDPQPDGGSGANIPPILTGGWPLKFRDFVTRHLEFLFVSFILIMVAAIFYYIPEYKIAFLNFFYLPVLAAGYFMGKRKAVLGAAMCILIVTLFAYFYPPWFAVEGTRMNALLLIAIWGGFLILASASVGSLQERLAKGFEETRQLLDELKRSRVMEEMKEKVEKTLYTTMDPVVARLATQGKLRFEKRDISIMFTDLTSFTAYSDQNRPDVVLEELNQFLGQMEPVIELFRGHIDKYMGDGMMIEFGAPVDYDRHALLAVLAGLKMQQKVRTLKLPWRLRVGIATGSSIVGMLGVRRQAYSALGDRVNVAKRLEEICQPDKVYIDEPTYRGVEHCIRATKLRNMGLGRQADVQLVERLGILEEKIAREGESPETLFEMGRISFQLHDASAAISQFERALALDPDSNEIKLAYADASIKKDEYEKIQVKGKSHRISVYEVNGIIDRWNDPSIIPLPLADKFHHAESLIDVPEDLVLAVEALDGSVGNARVVALLSFAVADSLKLSDDLKRIILQAGYVQDIGKEAVPHHIWNRAGRLTDQESKLLQKYVTESVSLLRRHGYVDPRLHEIVKHHHEAWNGSGFPDELRGDAIPIGARITGVCEAYSALTSWRPYRDAWDMRVALGEIRKGADLGRYDPQVVDALVEILKVPQ